MCSRVTFKRRLSVVLKLAAISLGGRSCGIAVSLAARVSRLLFNCDDDDDKKELAV